MKRKLSVVRKNFCKIDLSYPLRTLLSTSLFIIKIDKSLSFSSFCLSRENILQNEECSDKKRTIYLKVRDTIKSKAIIVASLISYGEYNTV